MIYFSDLFTWYQKLNRILICMAAAQKHSATTNSPPVWYLYIIRTVDDRLYTGISTDVERRFREHCNPASAYAAKYLKAHKPESVVFHQEIGNRSLAQRVEYRFKQLNRRRKDIIISQGTLFFDNDSGAITTPASGDTILNTATEPRKNRRSHLRHPSPPRNSPA